MPRSLVLKSLAIALLAMVLNVGASILWVFLYATFLAPGQSQAAIQAYAVRAVPYSAVIAGIPILFAAGWLLARWQRSAGWRSGIGAGIAYMVLDVAILLAAGFPSGLVGIVILSYGTKLAAAAAGGAGFGARTESGRHPVPRSPSMPAAGSGIADRGDRSHRQVLGL